MPKMPMVPIVATGSTGAAGAGDSYHSEGVYGLGVVGAWTWGVCL